MSDIDRGDDRADDRLDELLRSAARDYNRPPETPRELMWGRIEAARQELGPRPSDLGGVIPIRPRARRQWVRWAAGIAAALAIGFGLGRGMRGDGRGSQDVATTTEPTVSPSRAGPQRSPGTAPPAESPGVESTAEATRAAGVPEPREQRLAQQSPRAGVRDAAGSAGEPRLPAAEGRGPTGEGRAPNAAYTLAAIQHLTQAEALLTSFRAEARSGKQVDAQLSAWAKDLLVSTRLMLDSPAGRDPRMHRLLEDLELVLAQIAQLSTQRTGDELNLIDQAVEGRNVLPRLRTTIPAGLRPAGS